MGEGGGEGELNQQQKIGGHSGMPSNSANQ